MVSTARKLPLHVLPAFEAAARHGSFRAAAEELHLTPSAISHQIRLLEEALGVPLFERRPRGLQLTAAGRRYAQTVRESLVRLESEARALLPAPDCARLRLSMPDFVAHDLLLPGLSDFRARYPEVDLEMSTTMALSDVEAGEADAAVRIGVGTWGTLRSYLITELTATVVAAPALAADAAALSARGELPMVCMAMLEDHTRRTLEGIGLYPQAGRGLRVDNYKGLVQAAEAGLGVTVLFTTTGAVLESNEKLQALTQEPIAVPFSVHFVCRRQDSESSAMRALREWIASRFIPAA